MAVLDFIYLAGFVVSLVAMARIVGKAGYSPWWILVAFVPLVNFVMFLVFAFSDWPALASRPRGSGPPPGGVGQWTPMTPPPGQYQPGPGSYPPTPFPEPPPPPLPPFGGGTA